MNREDVRFHILKILREQPNYTTNQEVLLAALRNAGHAMNRDQLKIELAWLSANADAVLDTACQGVHIATLTMEGLEALEGTRAIPGIRRPLPGETG
ncbi:MULTISPECIES: VpaChn25_0724 family phage protein [Methylococcus]|jgi:hypothetical protein|uniref:Uncharacterized protein n=1 Tax=Methylococcus capsulatus TaxID=414 RepID=A0ABZ2F2Z6_METCP|nr:MULTISPECIES: hypothetical protein [Methylococcus]MDF9393854.1 ArsR family transcriptional regulator [Methylococcus capsulatus]